MKIIADTHTHTIVSGDAHSTILENVMACKARGLQYLCLTEHVNSIPRGCPPEYFMSLCSIPREHEGVKIVRGCEANILTYDGKLDVPDKVLDYLDIVIASLHDLVISPATKVDHTRCWLAIAENPHVDIIGHCGDIRYSFDLDTVIPAFKEHGKVVEINSHSFEGRAGSAEGCKAVALACKKYRVPVVVSSDAHFVSRIGFFDHSLKLLQETDFPEELVLNADEKRFEAYIESKKTNHNFLY